MNLKLFTEEATDTYSDRKCACHYLLSLNIRSRLVGEYDTHYSKRYIVSMLSTKGVKILGLSKGTSLTKTRIEDFV